MQPYFRPLIERRNRRGRRPPSLKALDDLAHEIYRVGGSMEMTVLLKIQRYPRARRTPLPNVFDSYSGISSR